MATQASVSVRTAVCNAVVTTLEAGSGAAKMLVCSGTKATNIADAHAGSDLVVIAFDDPGFAAYSGGSRAAQGLPNSGTPTAGGVATHCYIMDSDDNDCLLLTVGTTGTDIIINNANIVDGVPVNLNSFTITCPENQA